MRVNVDMKVIGTIGLLIAAVAASLVIGFGAEPSATGESVKGRNTCVRTVATIVGTGRGDKLEGTRRDDVFVGLGGKDEIHGRGGDDLICSGRRTDWVVGGPGKDRIRARGGRDFISGSRGTDRMKGGRGRDTVTGNRGERDMCAGGDPAPEPGRSKADMADTLTCERIDSAFRVQAFQARPTVASTLGEVGGN